MIGYRWSTAVLKSAGCRRRGGEPHFQLREVARRRHRNHADPLAAGRGAACRSDGV